MDINYTVSSQITEEPTCYEILWQAGIWTNGISDLMTITVLVQRAIRFDDCQRSEPTMRGRGLNQRASRFDDRLKSEPTSCQIWEDANWTNGLSHFMINTGLKQRAIRSRERQMSESMGYQISWEVDVWINGLSNLMRGRGLYQRTIRFNNR